MRRKRKLKHLKREEEQQNLKRKKIEPFEEGVGTAHPEEEEKLKHLRREVEQHKFRNKKN